MHAAQSIDHGLGPVEILPFAFNRPVGRRRRGDVAQVADFVSQFDQPGAAADVRRVARPVTACALLWATPCRR